MDAKVGGWDDMKDLPRTKALIVASDGAGALLRAASSDK